MWLARYCMPGPIEIKSTVSWLLHMFRVRHEEGYGTEGNNNDSSSSANGRIAAAGTFSTESYFTFNGLSLKIRIKIHSPMPPRLSPAPHPFDDNSDTSYDLGFSIKTLEYNLKTLTFKLQNMHTYETFSRHIHTVSMTFPWLTFNVTYL